MVTAELKPSIKKAQEVLEENFISEPPVDPYELVKNYGLEVREVDFGEKFKDVAGFIDLERDKIFVNQSDPPNRKKFTVAHELGHYLLHKEQMDKDPNISILYRIPLGKLNKDPIEKQANCFAANLLVPEDMLKRYAEEGEYNLNKLSEVFGVSKDLIGFRLKNVA